MAEPPEHVVVSSVLDARPPVIVESRVVEWAEIRPLLAEAAGASVLQEVVLDRALAPALNDAGITIGAAQVDAERALFYETLSDDPDVSARLARELRARQGLGRNRFERLLRRNASLRALVRDQVQVTDEAMLQLHQTTYGPKRQCRIMVLPTLGDAQAAITRLTRGEFFGDVAVDVSTDASAARGGLLPPLSRGDASYPEALREALWALAPGGVSPPVLLGDNYAVLTLVRNVDAQDVELDAVRAELGRQLRLSQERLLMDQLARRLFADSSVVIIDDGLKESWDSRFNR